jgi:chemotaxis protein methyltransferase CheR
VSPLDYEYLRKLLKDQSGLDLSVDKHYLIDSRLLPLSHKCGLPGISELVEKIKGGAAATAAQVVEAMTTNETFFFRDKTPFDHFRLSVVPEILRARAGRRSMRIWCAAGSTGQEPYSLAMCLKEMGSAIAGWRIEILATDLSLEVIEKFGVFDVVFCRNVLIYFDRDTKTSILNRLARATETDGYLVMGAAETAIGLTAMPSGRCRTGVVFISPAARLRPRSCRRWPHRRPPPWQGFDK